MFIIFILIYKMDSSANKLASVYKTIPLVGNKFQKERPSKLDKEFMLIHEDNNINDPNAIAVFSKRTDNTGKFNLVKLGYISKHHNTDKMFEKDNLDNIVIKSIIRSAKKNEDDCYYYYLVIE